MKTIKLFFGKTEYKVEPEQVKDINSCDELINYLVHIDKTIEDDYKEIVTFEGYFTVITDCCSPMYSLIVYCPRHNYLFAVSEFCNDVLKVSCFPNCGMLYTAHISAFIPKYKLFELIATIKGEI